MANYGWIVQIGVETINPTRVGEDWLDQWLHHVQVAMADEATGYTATGHGYDDTTKPFIEVTGADSAGAPLDTRLLVGPFDSGLVVLLGGRDEEEDQAASEAWAAAARRATEALGSPGTDFEWSALLGPPVPRMGGTEVALAQDVRVGPFMLTSSDSPVREMWTEGPSLGSASMGYWRPITVTGRSQGYNWSAAGRKAAFELHRLTTLLSVALESCLVVREAPAPLEWGVRRAPEQPSWQTWPQSDTSSPAASRNVVTAPDWLHRAWAELPERPWLGDALSVYHEGVVVQVGHPSLALVAFIGAIEAVSNHLFTEERCSACHAHKDVAGRFRETLRLVFPEDEAERLGRAYGRRSLTVHQGRLHGSETIPGSFGFRLDDPIREFDWQVVYAMGRGAARLLELALRGELPSRRAFTPCTARFLT